MAVSVEAASAPTSAPTQTETAPIPAAENTKQETTDDGAVKPPIMIDNSVNHHGAKAFSSADMQTTEFTGDVNTNNEIPSQEMLNNMAEISVLDRDGRSIPFKSIYTGPNVARRVLVIFIRHFFCGNCQEYLRTLTASITPATLLHLSTPTFIAVIGCGSPALIPMYQELTACPFPIYADPTKALYDSLGMLKTLNMGERPDYQRRGTLLGMVQSIGQGFKALKTGKALQAGDMQQVGGEFLFEPVDAATPMHSPSEETRQLGDAPEREGEEKRVTWCHRMRNTRDHAELPELREVLGLDGEGESGGDSKRWMKALRQRKGTGLSARSSGSVEGGRSARASSEKMMR